MEITLPLDKLRGWAERTPDSPSLHDRTDNGWTTVTWAAYWKTVKDVAKALISLGLQKDECAVIIANNRTEWLYAQFGSMAAGGIATPSYQTNSAEQLAYIINHSKAPVIFAENAEQYAKLVEQRSNLNGLRKVVLFDAVADADKDWTITFSDFLKLSSEVSDEQLNERLEGIEPDDTAFVIYTSGTTGVPKAVMTTHFHLSWMGETLLSRFHFPEKSRSLSYLPLSHIAEQIATNNLQLEKGGEVYMCSDFLKLKDYLPEVRPNALLGVPRVWEKVETALRGIIESSSGLKRKLLNWGLSVELAAFDMELASGKEVDTFSRRLANKLVINKIKGKLGMDRILHAFIGAAPSNLENLRFFASLGIPINEAYGMTETTGILCTTSPSNRHFGTVGKPLDGVEIKVADDGEVIARGPALTKGYMHDSKGTEELWEGGWLHTGDIGVIDENGNLRITDRKKDLIITAGAKNVAPQPIEAQLKRIDGISQAVVIGDKRPYLIALLTVDSMMVEGLATKLGVNASTTEELLGSDSFSKFMEEEVDRVNGMFSKFEKVGRFRVLPEDFTVESGELTPTMKMKRKVVNEKYADVIEEVYSSEN